jgi:undecaprenyl-diphosphatase
MEMLVIFAAKYLIAVMALALAGYAYFLPRQEQLRLGAIALMALPLVWALARIAGFLFMHEQPFAAGGFEPLIAHEVDNSFPSDHTAFAAVLAGLGYLYHRWLGTLLGAAALGVGIARIVSGLHYPVDIVASLLLGVVAVVVAKMVVSSLFQPKQ